MDVANQNDRPAGTAEDLFALELDRVPIEIAGKRFEVRGLSAEEEARIGILAGDETKKKQLNAIIASLTLMRIGGERVFSEGDVPKILKIPGKEVRRIVDTAMRVSALDEESRKALVKASAGTGDDA